MEALDGISKLDTRKNVEDINKEHLYYNKIFSTIEDEDDDELQEKTVKPFYRNKHLANIKTYGDLLAAENTLPLPKLQAVVQKKIESITYIRPNVPAHGVSGNASKFADFKYVTQNFIYSELILSKSTDHVYQIKWFEISEEPIVWDQVWESIHQQFFTEEVKSTLWEQIHLNFYTTYNYNKWHKSLDPCPLCRKIPEDIFHILLDCKFTMYMWKQIEGSLRKIIPHPTTTGEMAFGLQPRTKKENNATVLRNWITFSLRHQIMKEERRSYYIPNYSLTQARAFLERFNHHMKQELITKCQQYKFRGLAAKFDTIATINDSIGTNVGEEYTWNNIMQ